MSEATTRFLPRWIGRPALWSAVGASIATAFAEIHLKYEAFDTLFSMGIGWAINSAMVILAAATFFAQGIKVDALEQAEQLLRPMVGSLSALLFALALLATGLASMLTAGMAGGSIFAGLFNRPYDIHDTRTRQGIAVTLGVAMVTQFLVVDSFQAVVWSQVVVSVQMPVTVVLLIVLTSNPKVMGTHANKPFGEVLLWLVVAVVIALSVCLLAK